EMLLRPNIVRIGVLIGVALSPDLSAARAQRPVRPAATLTVTAETRLLVIAPHPDDEVLGAGGLMQRVHSTGGVIRVVYLTDGDGYPEGVRVEDRVDVPTAADYRGYGRLRKQEARAAQIGRAHV